MERLVSFDFNNVKLKFFSEGEFGKFNEVYCSPAVSFDNLVAYGQWL